MPPPERAAGTGELREILHAVREAEASLERRGRRAGAATMMIWGLVVATIFLFYHYVLHVLDPAVAHTLGEPLVRWFWVGPTLVGYVASAVVGARLGRVDRHSPELRSLRWLLYAIAPGLVVIVIILITGRGVAYIPGLWVAFLGLTFLLWKGRGDDRPPWPYRLAGWACWPLALVLLVLTPPWASLAAGLWYFAVLFGLGAYRYGTA